MSVWSRRTGARSPGGNGDGARSKRGTQAASDDRPSPGEKPKGVPVLKGPLSFLPPSSTKRQTAEKMGPRGPPFLHVFSASPPPTPGLGFFPPPLLAGERPPAAPTTTAVGAGGYWGFSPAVIPPAVEWVLEDGVCKGEIGPPGGGCRWVCGGPPGQNGWPCAHAKEESRSEGGPG